MSTPLSRQTTARRWAAGLALLALGCVSAPPPAAPNLLLQEGLRALDEGDCAGAADRAEDLIALLPDSTPSYALWRFHAEALAAQAHGAASLGAEFRTEGIPPGALPEGIGPRAARRDALRRPSTTSHLVATIHHVFQAREQLDRAVRIAAAHDRSSLPDELAALDVRNVDARLQVFLVVAYARLGFREEVDAILARSPEFLRRKTCFAALDRYGVPDPLRSWVCEMIFEHLRTLDEDEAYRFGVLAVEGGERFGCALPPEVIARVDHWIVSESSLLFVCPESQTPYLPGERRSPISGIPHLDYIGVKRPAGRR